MLLKTFRSQQPANYFILSALAFLLWLPAMIQGPVEMPAMHSMPLYAWLSGVFPGRAGVILAWLLVVAEALYLNILINRYEVLYKPSFLPALFYILLASFSREVMWLHPILIVNLLLLAFFDRSFSLFKNPSPTRLLFDASFFLGLACLVHLPSVIFYILLLLCMGIVRTLSGREWMVTAVGYFLPAYFMAVWFFWKGSLMEWVSSLSLQLPGKQLFPSSWETASIVEAILIFLLVMLALFRLRAHFYKNTIRTRSNQRIFVYTMFAGAASLLITPFLSRLHLVILALPLAVFIAYYFLSFRRRAWIGEALFGALVVVLLWNLF